MFGPATSVSYRISLKGQASLLHYTTREKKTAIKLSLISSGGTNWKFISVAHEEGNLNSFASILGNDIAIRAYREGKLPFPNGAIIAALHYRFVPSAENNKAFGRDQSFVAGAPTNVQFMVKDTKKYAASGGWGFGHFNSDGKTVDDAFMKTCFPCHQKIKERDLEISFWLSIRQLSGECVI